MHSHNDYYYFYNLETGTIIEKIISFCKMGMFKLNFNVLCSFLCFFFNFIFVFLYVHEIQYNQNMNTHTCSFVNTMAKYIHKNKKAI